MKNTLVKPFIRKAQKSDFKAFYNLYKKFEREYEEIAYEPFVKKTKKQLKKEYMLEDIKKELFYMAFINNKLVGYLEGILRNSKTGYISDLFVLKEFRSQGIASGLRNYFMQELKKRKYTKLELDVNIKNPAVDLYKKWGFKIVKYRMVKKLSWK